MNDARAAIPLDRSARLRRWHPALAGLVALLIGIGFSRFGYTPLIPALIGAGWFDAGAAAYLGATNLAGYLLGAALARRLAERVPASRLIKGAMVVGIASFLACALPWGFLWYAVWRLLSGVIGGILMVLAAPTVLAATPAARRGRVGGAIFTGVGLGIVGSGTLVPWLVRFGLSETWLCFAAVSAVLAAIAWGGVPPTALPPPGAARPSGARLSRPVLVLIVAYAFYGLGFAPYTVFWVDYIARGLGQGLAVGGSYWVVLGIGAALGPALCALFADRIGFGASLRLALFVMGLGLALPLLSTAPAPLGISSFLGGVLGTGMTALASGRLAELVAIDHQRQIWGWITVAFSIVFAASGYLLSFLFDRSHSYGLVFAIGAGGLLLGALVDVAATAGRPRGGA